MPSSLLQASLRQALSQGHTLGHIANSSYPAHPSSSVCGQVSTRLYVRVISFLTMILANNCEASCSFPKLCAGFPHF